MFLRRWLSPIETESGKPRSPSPADSAIGNREDAWQQLRWDFISALPLEIAVSIFGWIPDAQQLLKLCLVCKSWKAIILDNDVWRKVLFHYYSVIPMQIQPNWTQSNAPELPPLPAKGLGMVKKVCDVPLLPFYKARKMIDRNWIKSNVVKREIVGGHTDSVYCLQFDEGGWMGQEKTLIVSGSRDKTIKFWAIDALKAGHDYMETLEARPVKTLRGHEASVLCLQFSRTTQIPRRMESQLLTSHVSDNGLTSGLVVSGSSDHTVKLWDFASMEQGPIATIQAHSSPVLDVRFDNSKIITCSKDHHIRIWNLPDENAMDEGVTLTSKGISLANCIEGHQAAVNAIQFQDNLLVSASGDCTAKLWDMNKSLIREFKGHQRGLASAHFAPPLIITGSNDKTIRLWDLRVGERSGCIGVLEGHENLVRTVGMGAKYSNGAWKIVSGSYDESIKIWDQRLVSTGKSALLASLNKAHDSWVFHVQSNATKMVSASQDKSVAIWDYSRGVEDFAGYF